MSDKIKQKVLAEINKRNLFSCMNDTKWNELRQAMLNDMPFPPPFVIKSLLNENCSIEHEIYEDRNELGDWFYFGETVDIEWIKIRPRYINSDCKTEDASDKFEELLKRYNIPYEKNECVYCIYGYR